MNKEFKELDLQEVKNFLKESFDRVIKTTQQHYDYTQFEILDYISNHKVRRIPIGLTLYKQGKFQKTKRWETINDNKQGKSRRT